MIVMKKFKKVFMLLLATGGLLFYLSLFVAPLSVNAAPCTVADRGERLLGLPKWYKYLPGDDAGGECTPTVTDVQSTLPIGIAILEGAIALSGLVAVVMVFIGSFKFITSQGNGEAAAAARKTVINALIGVVIVIVASGVVSFIGNNVGAS